MSEEDQDGKLAARMARMKPAEAPKRRRGVNPYALSAVTAVAGVGVGAAAGAGPVSTPVPEALAPAKGISGPTARCWLTQTIPACIRHASARARAVSRDQTEPPSP